jgi:hypothetical protein
MSELKYAGGRRGPGPAAIAGNQASAASPAAAAEDSDVPLGWVYRRAAGPPDSESGSGPCLERRALRAARSACGALALHAPISSPGSMNGTCGLPQRPSPRILPASSPLADRLRDAGPAGPDRPGRHHRRAGGGATARARPSPSRRRQPRRTPSLQNIKTINTIHNKLRAFLKFRIIGSAADSHDGLHRYRTWFHSTAPHPPRTTGPVTRTRP